MLAHRIRLDPNNVQRSWLERCAGASRFVYNLGLQRWQEMYEAKEKPNWMKINAEVNARKKEDLDWLYELPCYVSNQSLRDVGTAYSNFFRRVKEGKEKVGYPQYKKKGKCKERFSLEGRSITTYNKRIKLPKLGWIRTREELRFPGKIVCAHFTKSADCWYVSLHVEVDDDWTYPHACETQDVVGIDLGVVDLAVLSTGEKVPAPRILRKMEDKLRRLNKELSRRKIGGSNWKKTKSKLVKLHRKIRNIRIDYTHNLTARIVRNYRFIGIENLNISSMMKLRNLAKSVADASLSEVYRQLLYKSKLSGSTIVQADRFFPSSKTCSSCNFKYKELKLSQRTWTCTNCGSVHDRDLNAAFNLKNLAAAFAVTACRHEDQSSPGQEFSFLSQ